ncbi:MAG: 4-(cytidine 5'-diphospho)-2-C-methyl-D-erythritol kinase [Bacteroidetes bacterium]|nr:4-(cytidine 5'-diphospho)-2-C-methyl-D-erythritol kinase [Bacteroidota bacterium]
MISFPNCKINLGLNITEKRTDSFHNIESVFYPINLCDILEIVVSSDKFVYSESGIAIPGNSENNLCVKAYKLLLADFDLAPIKLHLHKNIPFGAGLGGGSADAAFTIKSLNKLFSLNLSSQQMQGYAARLGSDCAFFIENKPIFAKGKGEIFEEIDFSLKGYFIGIIKSSVNVSTQEAYQNVIPIKQPNSIKDNILKPINDWKNLIENDFEKSVFLKFPELMEIKNKLYSLGAIYASMSGSGSSVFGIFETKIDLKPQFQNCFVWGSEL